jgi:starch synthase (maltosyl-transferring)
MADLQMTPGTGARIVHHAGDRIAFTLQSIPPGWQARLRTNVGRAHRLREEVVRSHFEKIPLAGASWRDLPMAVDGSTARIELPLTEVGFFRAKAFAIDPDGNQHWPHGADAGISVHPSWTRTANIIYCAFPRMFGPWSKSREATAPAHTNPDLKTLDGAGWTVIPPERDVARPDPGIAPHLRPLGLPHPAPAPGQPGSDHLRPVRTVRIALRPAGPHGNRPSPRRV